MFVSNALFCDNVITVMSAYYGRLANHCYDKGISSTSTDTAISIRLSIRVCIIILWYVCRPLRRLPSAKCSCEDLAVQ